MYSFTDENLFTMAHNKNSHSGLVYAPIHSVCASYFVETSAECQHNMVDNVVNQRQERLAEFVNAYDNNFNSFSDSDSACPKFKVVYNITTDCFQSHPLFREKTI